MNITSPNQLLYRVPPGRDTSGGRTASDRKTPTPVKVSAPQLRDGTDAAGVRPSRVAAAIPAGRSTSPEARLQRLPHNRLSELHAVLTYSGTAMGSAMAHGNNIDFYA